MAQIYYRENRDCWMVDYVDNQGKRHQERGGRIKQEAEDYLKKILADLHKEKIEGVHHIDDKLFSDFVDEYKKYAEKNKRKTTYDNEVWSYKKLKDVFGSKKLSQISVKDVQTMKDTLSIELSKATVNRRLALLKNMFTKAVEWGNAKDNPVKRVKFYKENNARVRYLNDKEYPALIANCDPSIKNFVLLAIHSGMRRGELLALVWHDVNFEKNLIHVRDSKSGEGRYIPINKTAKEVLEDLSKLRKIDNQKVFYEMTNFRKLFEAAVKKATIDNFHFHDTRHTFASNAVMSGMDLRTLMEILGHKTMAMTLRYSHLAPSHKMAAMQRMDSYINKSDKNNDDEKSKETAT